MGAAATMPPQADGARAACQVRAGADRQGSRLRAALTRVWDLVGELW